MESGEAGHKLASICAVGIACYGFNGYITMPAPVGLLYNSGWQMLFMKMNKIINRVLEFLKQLINN